MSKMPHFAVVLFLVLVIQHQFFQSMLQAKEVVEGPLHLKGFAEKSVTLVGPNQPPHRVSPPATAYYPASRGMLLPYRLCGSL